jgi:hypothetical protein
MKLIRRINLNLVAEQRRNASTYSSVFDRIAWRAEYKNEKLGRYEYFCKVQVERLGQAHQREQEVIIFLHEITFANEYVHSLAISGKFLQEIFVFLAIQKRRINIFLHLK